MLVVEGQIAYHTAGRWTDVGPGGVAYVPRGMVHCYRNVGTTLSRHRIIATPSGFEHHFARFAGEVARPGEPDLGRLVALNGGDGITFADVAEGRASGGA